MCQNKCLNNANIVIAAELCQGERVLTKTSITKLLLSEIVSQDET